MAPVTNQDWMIQEWNAGRASFVCWENSESATPERGGYYLGACCYDNSESPGYVEIVFWDADKKEWSADVMAGRRLYAWAGIPAPPILPALHLQPKEEQVGKTTLADGSPITPDHREINPETGMQKGYVVLSEEERAKGFVRPLRLTYLHEKCGGVTRMGVAIAETYARDPFFYDGTYCVFCKGHFPVGPEGEFTWTDTTEKVGT